MANSLLTFMSLNCFAMGFALISGAQVPPKEPNWMHVLPSYSATNSPVIFDKNGLPIIVVSDCYINACAGQVFGFQPAIINTSVSPNEVALQVNGNLLPSEIVTNHVPCLYYTCANSSGPDSHIEEICSTTQVNQELVIGRATICHQTPNLMPNHSLAEHENNATLSPPLAQGEQLFLFKDNKCIGNLKAGDALNVTPMDPGEWDFKAVDVSPRGTVTVIDSMPLIIGHRFDISSPADQGSAVLATATSDVKIDVKYLGEGNCKTVRLFVDGALKTTVNGNSFDAKLSMPEMPSGKVVIGIVGVLEDGKTTALETHSIEIINKYCDDLMAKDLKTGQELTALHDLQNQMPDLDEKVAYWYEKGIDEPDFKISGEAESIYTVDEFGDVASVGYIDLLVIPGDAAEYFANCRAAIVERAALRLKIGEAEKQLGMLGAADQAFAQVVREAGESSGIGAQAKSEITGRLRSFSGS